MKRVGNLWSEVTSWANLLASAHAAARGKRTRPDVARFLANLEPNLCQLKRELLDGSYQPGEYRTFEIRDPKPRMISAAPFRDRVVHHALTRVLEPVFERRFTANSFASRKGFGQHAALRRAKAACARYKYVLKCDIRKYFPSIDHQILKEQLARVVKCKPTLALAGRIIDASNPQEESSVYFPGDDLFTPLERRRGLPIGNQTSQFFANVYLNALDHFVLRELRPALYLRYVDDFVLFGDCRDFLNAMLRRIEEFLDGLRLRPHPRKSRVYRCADGLTFLGWRLFPGRTRLKRANVVRMRRRLHEIRAKFHEGALDFAQVRQRVQSWLGHARHGDTLALRRAIFTEFILNGAERGRRLAAGRFLEQHQQRQERPGLEP
ncbi:MAG: RNA-dependent DNA polymerase [Acidobacteria bacterium]|nr:RNA-dependent DNA polymerase [Acidobacteriota bacterium]